MPCESLLSMWQLVSPGTSDLRERKAEATCLSEFAWEVILCHACSTLLSRRSALVSVAGDNTGGCVPTGKNLGGGHLYPVA